MNWVKSLRARALLMSGQRSQDMEIRGLDADSDQALVEQIQVPCALINPRAGRSMQEAGEKFEGKWGLILVSHSQTEAYQAGLEGPMTSQTPNSQRASRIKES